MAGEGPMKKHEADIVIFGAGIAGLWLHHRLRRLGYSVLLLESDAIGGGQTIASQGILHSGLKYAFAGKINKLAQSISAMPDRWRTALKAKDDGGIDLSAARMKASSQYLMIPSGMMGGLVKLVTKRTLGESVHDVSVQDWPEDIRKTGFNGSVIYMGEPVLDIPSVLRALAEPYKDSIRRIDTPEAPLDFLEQHAINAKLHIFTGAASNHEIAQKLEHDAGVQTQKRPLLMGMMKPAPFPLYAHLVGSSDKPVATITTHEMSDGTLVWYLGGGVAEREKDSNPQEVIDSAKAGFTKYLPQVDLSQMEWATLPIDRIEGKSDTDGWMPDTPTIHTAGNCLYCWPTKLTFAPLLADSVLKKIDFEPSNNKADWSFLPEVGYAQTPWDKATWKKDD